MAWSEEIQEIVVSIREWWRVHESDDDNITFCEVKADHFQLICQ